MLSAVVILVKKYVSKEFSVYQHTISPTYFSPTSRRSRSWMLIKFFHQHTGFSPTYIFHQNLSPTLKQPIYLRKLKQLFSAFSTFIPRYGEKFR